MSAELTDDLDVEALTANFAAEQIGPAEGAWMQEGVNAWLRSDGAVSLERCLHLPTSPKAMARVRRDKYLRLAWNQIDEPGPSLRAAALVREINAFETRIWPAWRKNAAPPPGASELRSALFWAFKSGARIPTSDEHFRKTYSQTFR